VTYGVELREFLIGVRTFLDLKKCCVRNDMGAGENQSWCNDDTRSRGGRGAISLPWAVKVWGLRGGIDFHDLWKQHGLSLL
jgi:hypothetical protein